MRKKVVRLEDALEELREEVRSLKRDLSVVEDRVDDLRPTPVTPPKRKVERTLSYSSDSPPPAKRKRSSKWDFLDVDISP